MLAVIRIRGPAKTDRRTADTLRMLRLNRINHCILAPENPVCLGMLQKAKNWVTWGRIDENTLEKLIFKRGRTEGNSRIEGKEAKLAAGRIIRSSSMDGLNIRPVFRLSPPSKGHGPVRLSYPRGAAGPREEGINELIKRMI
jgi:large subunit ribosomal protein L30